MCGSRADLKCALRRAQSPSCNAQACQANGLPSALHAGTERMWPWRFLSWILGLVPVSSDWLPWAQAQARGACCRILMGEVASRLQPLSFKMAG